MRDTRASRLSIRQRTFWARAGRARGRVGIIRPPRALRRDDRAGPATFEWTRLAPGAAAAAARARATRTDFSSRTAAACACAARTGCRTPRAARRRRRARGAMWASAPAARRRGHGAGDDALADVPCVVLATATRRAASRRSTRCASRSSGRARAGALRAGARGSRARLRPALLYARARALFLSAAGATLCALDCAGSSLSDGEYVSLGHFEQYDVQAVCEHLRGAQRAGAHRALGRSMGAVACLLDASRNDPCSRRSSRLGVRVAPELARELVAKATGAATSPATCSATRRSHVSSRSSTARASPARAARARRRRVLRARAAAPRRERRVHRPTAPARGRVRAARASARVRRRTHASTRPAGVLALAAVCCGATCTAPRR